MDKTILLVIVSLICLIIFIAFGFILFLVVKNFRNNALDVDVIEKIKNNKKVELNELNEFLKENIVSKDNLDLMSKYFLENFNLQNQDNKNLYNVEYFNFVSLFAASKNADAKMISLLNKDLRAKYPNYGNEIDIIETKGLDLRK